MSQQIIYKVDSHEATRENIKIHDAILERILRFKPKSVLEIGAGIGLLGNRIANEGIRYVGLEPDADQLQIATTRHPDIKFLQGSCYENPDVYNLGKFDLVFSTDVIEHLYMPRDLVGFAKAHISPEGCVLTCTPEFGSYWKNLAYSITNKWERVHSPLWDGGHIKFFSRKSMQAIFAEQGFGNFQWGTVRNVNFPILPMSMICTCRLSA